MDNLILEPLKFYDEVGKEKNALLAKNHFESLLSKSGINVEENRKTAQLYRKQEHVAEITGKKSKQYKVLRGFLIALSIIAFIIGFVGFSFSGLIQILCPSVGLTLGIVILLVIFLKLNKIIKNIDKIYLLQKEKANETLKLCYGQVARLNSMFTENDVLDIIEKTVPDLKFDNHYAVKLQNEFKNDFGFNDQMGSSNSVLNTLSGRYNENPFLFTRYLSHHLGSKTYHGSLVISWRTTVRDSNGRYRTVTKTQTLHASVVKPYPYYNVHTSFIYGHQTAPDLNFSRQATDVEELNDKQVQKRVRKRSKKLKERAENAITNGGNFTQMTNEEFDVIFGAIDRDNEVQFRVMFSPLAQINMVKLLRSKSGYGDDFSFIKRGKVNTIISEHAQRWSMDTSPNNYISYDVDIIRNNFVEFSAQYFKSVFFDFAPVLTVPAYHTKYSQTFESLKNQSNYTDYAYEVMANQIGRHNFEPQSAVTESILKTKYMFSENQSDCVEVTANAYEGYNRTDFVSVLGGDGRFHAVPVPWTEYLPVSKTSTMIVKQMDFVKKDFKEREEKLGYNQLLSRPWAYYNGLFAQQTDTSMIKWIDGALTKIKNT